MVAGGTYELTHVKTLARGRWDYVLTHLASVSPDDLTGRHGPCPKCGGKDRFRVFGDFSETGGSICNSCGKFADGIASLQAFRQVGFSDALKLIGDLLGASPTTRSMPATEKPQREKLKCDFHLEFAPEIPAGMASIWTLKKRPIVSSSLSMVEAKYAKYRHRYPVFAIPARRDGNPVGYALYHATNQQLPIFQIGSKEPVDWKKIKVTTGSEAGWIGPDEDDLESIVWKVEGPSDLLALLSLDLPAGHSAVCNLFGAQEDPAKNLWMLDRFRKKTAYVIHDCDAPGQQGATSVVNAIGKTRPGWSPAIATVASECRNVVLPYEIVDNHGKDLRDWIQEKISTGLSKSDVYLELLKLAQQSVVVPAPNVELKPPAKQTDADKADISNYESEAIDDPHRLARLNIRKYQEKYGRHIRYWKETWYTWKAGVYEEMSSDHLLLRLNGSIKEEFDRAWEQEIRDYVVWTKSDDYARDRDRGAPKVRKVTTALVNNVIEATKSFCSLTNSQQMHAWTDSVDRGFCVSVGNGILNITKAISPDDPPPPRDEILMSHTPNWFSTAKLYFDFDEHQQCPSWIRFLLDVFNGDEQSILSLQKWFGYLLTPDNSLQKIMFVIGEKRSGKGTIISIMTELFGRNNIATPTLGGLSKEFSLQPLIGKTIAILPDVRLSERVDEVTVTERLLSISGGDPQDIARKYKDTLASFALKIRFTLFSNLLPRIKDPSAAFLSRCIFLRMPNSYLGREDIGLQDRLKKELSGILNWAIIGRHYLNQHPRIDQPSMGQSLVEEMADIVSPLLRFLEEECAYGDSFFCDTKLLFSCWEQWCEDNDVAHAGTIQSFARRIKAVKPNIETKAYKDNMNAKRRRFEGIEYRPTAAIGGF